MDYFVRAIPFFLGLIVLEFIVGAVQKRSLFSFPDSLNNLSCGILQELVSLFSKAAMALGYVFVYEHFAIRQLEPTPWTWLAVLLGVDFFYYWFHRASHRVAFFWAFHVVHHQSEEYNLTVALRQSALGGFVSWIFYLPLALLGFPPEMLAVSYAANLLFQFWIHTRAVKTLGPVEWIFNTPSHHRVHHGRNLKYIDRNYAGALIVWDKLFGTFQEEEEEPVYGIVHPLRSWNPIWANLHVWHELIANARQARTLGDKLRCFTRPPGWQPSFGNEMPPLVVDLTGPKYSRMGSRWTNLYVFLNFVGITAVSTFLFFQASTLTMTERIGLGVFILFSLVSFSALFEGKRWAWRTEWARAALAACLAGMLLVTHR